MVERKYTPVSALEVPSSRHGQQATPQGGGDTIGLMIKLYRDGKMSGFLSKLHEGKFFEEQQVARKNHVEHLPTVQ